MAFSLFPEKMNQWKVVLIAFATATTFWFFNSLNKNYTTNLSHPVVFLYDSDSLIAVKPLPGTIELDVSGGGWSLLRKTAWFNPKPVTIELKNPTGIRIISWVELLPSIREQMTEITVNRVLQDTLRVQIEPIKQKQVVLYVDSTQLDLKDSHRLVSSVQIPNPTITLSGPKSFIDTLDTHYLLAITEEGLDRPFDKLVSVRVPRPDLIKSTPAQVNVQFEVEKFDRLQIELPVEAVNFPKDSSRYLKDNMVSVFFTVQRSKRGEYVKKNFRVLADYKTLARRDSVIIPVLVEFPDEIMDIELTPATLNVFRK
jgi:hypothetical protein